jgi:hypothetical protein
MMTLSAARAQAHIIELGRIDLTGDFTLNHNYDFNHPAAFPFGTFGTQAVENATGIFSPYVSAGDILAMNTQFMFGPISPVSWVVSQPMMWTIGGFTIDTQFILITGADFVGRNGLGLTDLSGNGFDPSAYGLGAFSNWNFTAPPYDIRNFDTDITGPIKLQIIVRYDVAEGGNTLVFLALSLFGLICVTQSTRIGTHQLRR